MDAKPAELIDSVIQIAHRAGGAILEVYESPDFNVELKGDDSPLTRADIAANKLIVDGLSSLTPDIPVLSEESKQVPYADRKDWTVYWLVDPLDGTKEFIKRNGEFTVNIALVSDGVPVLGVVYAPVLHRTYYAAAGVGAFVQEGEGRAAPIKTAAYGGDPIKIVASRSHAGPDLQGFLDRVGEDRKSVV